MICLTSMQRFDTEHQIAAVPLSANFGSYQEIGLPKGWILILNKFFLCPPPFINFQGILSGRHTC